MTRLLHRALAPLPLCVLSLCAFASSRPPVVTAQVLDRTKPPELAPPPALSLPAVRTATLPNGARLVVVEMREVPLVHLTLAVAGGGREDGDLSGLASFAGNMLDEGAGSRDANAIAAEAAYLGASLFTGANWNATTITLRVPKRTLGPALDLLADVALRPTFAAAEVKRQRDLRIANIIQQRDVPQSVGALAFNSIVFPEGHPYHRPLGGDSASTAALDSAVVRRFYQRTMRPDRAVILVTGDVTLAEAQAELGRRLAGWRIAGEGAADGSPVRPAAKEPVSRARTVYLVDKPGAAQSVIRMGHRGVQRSNPDYYAIEVMNTLLGGSFSSRLNTNLRETKGYTYGARSGFDYQPVPGAFQAAADVRTDVTDSSLVEFFGEFRRIRDSLVPEVELDRAKRYLALGLLGDFETTGQVAGQLNTLLTFGLPFTWFNDYVAKVMGVSTEDLRRVARTYVRPDSLSVIVVGDVAKIRPGIERLGLGPVVVRSP